VYPNLFEKFIPRLGGMHTLMSFIGSVGYLMANTGLETILQSAFAGVPKLLSGKKFPQNFRALRLTVEELLRNHLDGIKSFSNLTEKLDALCVQSRTSKVWIQNLIKPVMIMMVFVRAEREGDWFLHLSAVQAMLPYFFAAGHFNYARYTFF
jgi:hypothetical protein